MELFFSVRQNCEETLEAAKTLLEDLNVAPSVAFQGSF
jgi:hypothetical protein